MHRGCYYINTNHSNGGTARRHASTENVVQLVLGYTAFYNDSLRHFNLLLQNVREISFEKVAMHTMALRVTQGHSRSSEIQQAAYIVLSGLTVICIRHSRLFMPEIYLP